MICEPGDVVVVPFPFVERRGGKRRPAAVLSEPTFNARGHTVLAMITTRSHPAWPHDIPVTDLDSAGLPRPCIVRLKLFTLDNRLLHRLLGRLAVADRNALGAVLAQVLRPA